MENQLPGNKGLLEGFLSRKRGHLADKLIPNSLREGRILDIGSSVTPLFLLSTVFTEKFGLDKAVPLGGITTSAVRLSHCDLEKESALPFGDGYFEVVTLLAVFEHIMPGKTILLLNEIYRILKPGGLFVLTVPNAWTDKLLTVLAWLGIVNAVLRAEHKDVYTVQKLRAILGKTNFGDSPTKSGYFECYANIWMTIQKR